MLAWTREVVRLDRPGVVAKGFFLDGTLSHAISDRFLPLDL